MLASSYIFYTEHFFLDQNRLKISTTIEHSSTRPVSSTTPPPLPVQIPSPYKQLMTYKIFYCPEMSLILSGSIRPRYHWLPSLAFLMCNKSPVMLPIILSPGEHCNERGRIHILQTLN